MNNFFSKKNKTDAIKVQKLGQSTINQIGKKITVFDDSIWYKPKKERYESKVYPIKEKNKHILKLFILSVITPKKINK